MTAARLLIILALLFTLAQVARAEDPYRPGDEIRFKFLGEWTPGTVLEVHDVGWCTIEFQREGKTEQRKLPARRLRKLDEPTERPRPNVGDTVEFEFMRHTCRGTVTRVDDHHLTVRFDHRERTRERTFFHDRVRKVSDASATTDDAATSTTATNPQSDPLYALTPDRSSTRPIEPDRTTAWRATPAGVERTPLQTTSRITLGYGNEPMLKPGMTIPIHTPHGPAILASTDNRSPRAGGIRLQRIDLSNDRPQAAEDTVAEGPLNRRLVAASADGTLVALTGARAASPFIELFRLEGRTLTPHLRIEPQTQAKGIHTPWAAFTPSGHALISFGRNIECWNLETGTCDWTTTAARHDCTFTDPGARLLFLPISTGTAILQLPGGEHVGNLNERFLTRARVAVRPDAGRIAWLAHGCLVLRPLTDASAPERRIALPPDIAARSIAWLDNTRVLIDRELILDIPTATPVGRVDINPFNPVTCAHGTLWINTPGPDMRSRHALLALSPPRHPHGAVDLLQSPVTITANTGDATRDTQLRRLFTRRLEALGVNTATDGNVTLTISATPDGTEQRTYRMLPDNSKVTRTANKMRWSATLSSAGATRWESRGTWSDLPATVSLRKGQSLDDALHDAARSLVDRLTVLRLPTVVPDVDLENVPMLSLPDTTVAGIDTNADNARDD